MDSGSFINLIEQGISELGWADTFFVDLKIKGNKIEVFVDSDGGINFSTCQKLSRWIEAVLDEKKYFGEAYTLEVSSPGVGTPMKLLRQYPKNIGRTIEIKTSEKSVRGILKKIENDIIFVESEMKVKEGNKNKKVIVTDEIKYENIIESKIKINFNP
jgi:ribosome maturation factor RimP